MNTAKDMADLREHFVHVHRDWKRRSWTSDLIARGEWSTIWGDLTTEETQPLIENLYVEALEDKAATAGSIVPRLLVAPSRGTRSDRAEDNAQKRRRAFISIEQRSNLRQLLVQWYLDWWQHGAMYSLPYTDFADDERYPYIIRMDPRQAYPCSHDSRGNLTSIFFARNRRFQDIEQEWGYDHPTVGSLRRRRGRMGTPVGTPIEELWHFDTTNWSVAIRDDGIPPFGSQYRYVSPLHTNVMREAPVVDWLMPPNEHKMYGCPVTESKRHSSDGEYRGALDVMIPMLRVAQNLAARQLEDIELQIFAPVIIEGVLNDQDYGPGAKLIGDGSGRARVEYSRPPMSFDASQKIDQALVAARNVGKYPQQRQGEAGASIISAKGVNAVMGTFNTEIAWAQTDLTHLYQNSLGKAACLDEKWCPGSKRIDGFDEGEMYSDTYNAENLWRGDYRVFVTFGGGLGLDQQGYMLTLATARNMEGLSMRSFMTKSGLVENPLNEEREMVLERLTSSYLNFAEKQADEGNPQPMYEVANMIDDDKLSARAAILEVIKKAQEAVPTEPTQPPGGMGGGFDPVGMARSMASGGVPGSADQLLGMGGPPGMGAPVGPSVAGLMPPGALANIGSELMPGGTAA